MHKQVNLGADFRLRTLTGLVSAPIVLFFVWVGNPWMLLFSMTAAIIGASELNNVIRPGRLGWMVLLVLVVACIASIYLRLPEIFGIAIIIAVIIGMTESYMVEHSTLRFFWRNWVYLVAGSLYLSIPMALLVILRDVHDGRGWIFTLLFSNWATDVFALIGGRLLGKHKLAPRISPSKTWEGAFTGILMGGLIGLGVGRLFSLPVMSVVALALIVPPLTVLGDLLESWLKRNYKVKDSGELLPGHGGILDRIDGLLLATPGLYFVLWLLWR